MSERNESHEGRPPGTSPGPSPGPRASLGPIVLLVPLFSLVIGVLWARRARTPWNGRRPAPPALEEASERDAWVGETTRDGARIVARLLPLHDAHPRLAFERDVLAERLRLGAGRPWRLELAYHELDAAAAGLELTNAQVIHDAGALALAVSRAPEPPEDGVADPLQVLLAPPGDRLEAGREVTLVLWGPAPEGVVRLVTPGLELVLEPRRVAAVLVPETLARLDRGGAR